MAKFHGQKQKEDPNQIKYFCSEYVVKLYQEAFLLDAEIPDLVPSTLALPQTLTTSNFAHCRQLTRKLHNWAPNASSFLATVQLNPTGPQVLTANQMYGERRALVHMLRRIRNNKTNGIQTDLTPKEKEILLKYLAYQSRAPNAGILKTLVA